MLFCEIFSLRLNTNYLEYNYLASSPISLVIAWHELEIFWYIAIYINSTNSNHLAILGLKSYINSLMWSDWRQINYLA